MWTISYRIDRVVMHWIRRAAVFLLLVWPFVETQAAPDALLFKKGETVAFLGDSLTVRGKAEPYGFINLLDGALKAEGIPLNLVVSGGNGHQASHLDARLEKDILSQKPDWVFVSCGVNDVQSMKPVAEFETHLVSILEKCRMAGVKPILITTTLVFDGTVPEKEKRVTEYAETMRTLAKKHHLPLVDVNEAMHRELPVYKGYPTGFVLVPDGLHLGSIGNQILAASILRTLGVSEEKIAALRAEWSRYPDAVNVELAKREFAEFTVDLFHLYCKEAMVRKLSLADFLRPRRENGLFLLERALMDAQLSAKCGDAALDYATRKRICQRVLSSDGVGKEILYVEDAKPTAAYTLILSDDKGAPRCLLYGDGANQSNLSTARVVFPKEQKSYEFSCNPFDGVPGRK